MRTDREWGYYSVLYETDTLKVKELVVNPKSSLSYQKHFHRNEHWQVVEGKADVLLDDKTYLLSEHDTIEIPVGSWHQLMNMTHYRLKLIEIQYGSKCVESDIIRK